MAPTLVQDVMTPDPACCSPETRLSEAARLMVGHDCGELPVLDEGERPIGVVTDRDIGCRGMARERPRRRGARGDVSTGCDHHASDGPGRLPAYHWRRIRSAASRWWTKPESAVGWSPRPTLPATLLKRPRRAWCEMFRVPLKRLRASAAASAPSRLRMRRGAKSAGDFFRQLECRRWRPR